ncbi:potassium ion transport [Aureococcus anophagefferens]|nr:potassium ion transport [Aureococcus anophagefferens]
MDEVLLCLDRGDASSFTLKLATKGKAVTAKKLLATTRADADVAAAPPPPRAETKRELAALAAAASYATDKPVPIPASAHGAAPPRRRDRRRRARRRARPAALPTPTKKLSSRELVASTVAHFDAHADEIDRLLTEVRRMAQLDDAIDASLATMATPRNLALRRARGSSTLRFLELGCGAGVDAAALAAAGSTSSCWRRTRGAHAAGFELVERTTASSATTLFAGVWRCAAPPKSRAAVAAARKPKRRAAPAADIPGLP